jgi:hypothetical protein
VGQDTYVDSTTYTATGGIDTQDLGNGVVNEFTYDPVSNRLTHILTGETPQNPLVDLSYTYDNVGNITQINDGVHEEISDFTYDHLDRLTVSHVKLANDTFVE